MNGATRADPPRPGGEFPVQAGRRDLPPALRTLRPHSGRPLRRLAQLRLRHHRPDHHHHAGSDAGHGEEHQVDAGHAAAAARDEEAPGQVQGRGEPGTAQPGDDEALQGERDQPVRGLPPQSPADALPHCAVLADPRALVCGAEGNLIYQCGGADSQVHGKGRMRVATLHSNALTDARCFGGQ